MKYFQFQNIVCATLFLIVTYTTQAQDETFEMTQIGVDFSLDKPWDLHYGPDDYLWVTEREAGVVVRINPTTAERDELITIPDLSSTAGQDGLLGLALHNDFLTGSPYVYVSYTHLVSGQRTQKLVRYTYTLNGNDGSLSAPEIIIDNLPSSNDHNSGRLIFGVDEKLYYTIGDQGANQGGNYCNPNLAQVLPTQNEIDQEDWTNYPGKVLRLNLDGSIPADNPMLDGVRSHVFSYGHRNAQGIVMSNNGILYADEHGPNTDDEVNLIAAGMNYGWPNIAGYQDDQAYDYCNWSSVSNCQDLNYSSSSCNSSIDLLEESTFMMINYQEPLMSMFAVTDDYDYNNPACSDSWICRPNVAPSSIGIYESDAIPFWTNSLLVSSLKRGRIYRLKLSEDGTSVVGDTTQHFYTPNRYRDIVVSPDGESFYVITDASGKTSDASGLNQVTTMQNPGTILKFSLVDPTSVTNEQAASVFQIFPNPASDYLYIDLKDHSGKGYKAELINTTGQVIKVFSELQAGVNEVSVNNFPVGIYLLKVSSKNNFWQQRVVLN